MSARPVMPRVVGAVSIIYAVLLGIFLAWSFWNLGRQKAEVTWVMALLRIVLIPAAPILLDGHFITL